MQTSPTRFVGLKTIGFMTFSGCLFLLTGCPDSLHLDPQPTPGTSSGSTGGGGNSPVPCSSSADCPLPTSVCDTIKRICVECLTHDDCSYKPGTLCSTGLCECPNEGESFCGSLGTTPARCADLTSSTRDCGSCGHECFGACNAGQCADPWEPTSLVDAPAPRHLHTAVWTGTQMIVWGGSAGGFTNTGGIYDPASNTWTATSLANAPTPRRRHTAVWTGSVMVVWGGEGPSGLLSDGGMFDPAENKWTSLSKGGAPSARMQHTAVWDGSAMIVWGGINGGSLGDGAKFNPASNSWAPLVMGGAPPTERREHTAIWAESGTNSRMLVYGGIGVNPAIGDGEYLSDGAALDPDAESWTPLTPGGEPSPRNLHTAVWTGTSMVVWGGHNGSSFLADGGACALAGLIWSGISAAPIAARQGHTAVWIPSPVARMVVWGGENSTGDLNDGSIYNPAINQWIGEMPTAPTARAYHTAIVADTKMIIWGGHDGNLLNTGAIFDAAATP